jgi:predicted hydrocarbon binding protein
MTKKNITESLKNSIMISRKLAKSLTGQTPPEAYDCLTEFGELLNKKSSSFDIIEVSAFMDKLLLAGKQKWKWNDSDYKLARADSNNRIANYILAQNAHQYLSSELKDLSDKFIAEKDKLITEEDKNIVATKEIERLIDSINSSRVLRVSKKIKSILRMSN